MRKLFLLIASGLSLQIASAQEQTVYTDLKAPLEKRVEDLFGRLTNAGDYEIEIGASSRDIRLKKAVNLSADFMASPAN